MGPDVTDIKVGDRVAYTMVMGTYAEYASVPADRLVKIPAARELPAGGSGHAARDDSALPFP